MSEELPRVCILLDLSMTGILTSCLNCRAGILVLLSKAPTRSTKEDKSLSIYVIKIAQAFSPIFAKHESPQLRQLLPVSLAGLMYCILPQSPTIRFGSISL
jgi:hypothetical protein